MNDRRTGDAAPTHAGPTDGAPTDEAPMDEAPVGRQPLSQAPIRQATMVRSDVEHTFGVFVREIGKWWPTQPFSLGGERVTDVVFEERAGGRVYEVWDDGTETTWGRVLVWEPPSRFRITWEIHPGVTEVEVQFQALGPGLTRVALTHEGWERLSQEELAAATSVEIGYSAGWARILDRLQQFAGVAHR